MFENVGRSPAGFSNEASTVIHNREIRGELVLFCPPFLVVLLCFSFTGSWWADMRGSTARPVFAFCLSL